MTNKQLLEKAAELACEMLDSVGAGVFKKELMEEILALCPTPSDEVRRLEEDARRYRWLRDVANIDDTVSVMDWRTSTWGNPYYTQVSGDELDKAIDAALSHKEEAE